MGTDFLSSDRIHLAGERATHSPAPRSTRQAALLLLAGTSPQRRRALPDTPITAPASAFNCRFQVQCRGKRMPLRVIVEGDLVITAVLTSKLDKYGV